MLKPVFDGDVERLSIPHLPDGWVAYRFVPVNECVLIRYICVYEFYPYAQTKWHLGLFDAMDEAWRLSRRRQFLGERGGDGQLSLW